MKVLMIINGVGPTEQKRFAGIFYERQLDSLSGLGIEISRVYVGRGISLSQTLRSIPNLLREQRKANPDIVHAQYGSMTGFLGVLTHGRTPLIISFCGSDLLGSHKSNGKKTLKSRISIQLSKLSARYASGIIVKSKELMEILPNHCRSKAGIIPNGVDLKIFYPMNQNETRKKLGLPLNKKIILFNRESNGFVKNLKLAQAAFKLLQKKRKDVIFFSMYNELPERVPLLMNACDTLLLTSFHEGSPNVVKEALACNLPIVSVPCGDVRERLRGVYPSFVVDYSAEALADALDKALEIGKRSNGREEVKDLAIEKITEEIKAFYSQIIKKS